MKTFIYKFADISSLDQRVKLLEKDPDELKGAKIISATLKLDDGHEVPYMGYDGPRWKLLLIHATSLVIKYQPSNNSAE